MISPVVEKASAESGRHAAAFKAFTGFGHTCRECLAELGSPKHEILTRAHQRLGARDPRSGGAQAPPRQSGRAVRDCSGSLRRLACLGRVPAYSQDARHRRLSQRGWKCSGPAEIPGVQPHRYQRQQAAELLAQWHHPSVRPAGVGLLDEDGVEQVGLGEVDGVGGMQPPKVASVDQ